MYATPVNTLDELEVRSRDAFATITPEMIVAARGNIEVRLQHCVAAAGVHFEYAM